MKIELISWQAQGLRCPDAKIDLCSGGDHVPKVALIQMPNGTGKTTTLDCLRAAMDGSARSWSEKRVLEYQDSEKKPDTGKFLTTLKIEGSNRLVIEMTFDFDHGCVTYKTTYGSKNEDGYCPPPKVGRYLDPQFSELLFFNGELANQLIDGTQGSEASAIIDTFYGLYHLKRLQDLAQAAFEDAAKKGGRTVKAKTLTILEAKLGKLRKRQGEIVTEQSDAKEKAAQLKTEIQALERSTEEHLLNSEKFREREQEAIDNRHRAEMELEDQLQKISSNFANPVFLYDPLREQLQKLADNFEVLRLPEPSSAPFFKELVKEDVCICDREMNDGAKAAIERRAEEILGDSVTGFLNSFKDSVRNFCGEACDPSFEGLMEQLNNSLEALDAAQSKLDDIRREAEESGDMDVSAKQEELKEKKKKIQDLSDFIDETERKTQAGDGDDCDCLDYYAKEIQQAEKKLAELTGSLDLKARTDCLKELLDVAYREAHNKLKESVIDDANTQLREILKFNLVQIEDIGKSVKLDGRLSGSVGQNLSVGYVFLAGLLHGGGNQFPLVVDSPAGALDDVARRQVGGLLPELIGQLVAFVIASEREWFVEPLAEAAGNDVVYLTHLRLNEYTSGLLPSLGGEKVSETDDGIVLEGKECFFQLGVDSVE
ncbi:MAG: AAA family ATPase [Verrucomicrobiales bacterium]|nr:AAA family ATPase [Verrucomicrobiales bacterium]